MRDFWYHLAVQATNTPDHLFLQDVIGFGWGRLQLELFNVENGRGVPREFVLALAKAMLVYSDRGFCGMFNARVTNMDTLAKLWVSFRII